MARITKSSAAPADAQTFTVGQVTIDLSKSGATYETDDRSVIASAREQEWLSVEEDAPAAADVATATADPNDPHQNPSADHLTAAASDAALAAAAANEAAIRASVGLELATAADAPTTAETLQETFDFLGADSEPELPEAAPAPADPAPALTFSRPDSSDDAEATS